MPGYTDMKYDEFKCLSLTITTPLKCMSEGGSVYRETEKLPVLVYVHGGGFIEGGGSVNDSHGEYYLLLLVKLLTSCGRYFTYGWDWLAYWTSSCDDQYCVSSLTAFYLLIPFTYD